MRTFDKMNNNIIIMRFTVVTPRYDISYLVV